ncbi:MAG: FumA C-terminus/TtdB family hydratase beta subunit [Candidatus Hodarchaeaceae archaeon]|nr:FumA C-terminus/TtdB family hydratase beta subunit [Candidatus Hodarchaeaceae archaeon]MDI6884299.1 FumA C-terminus/TtdB family hydratase beta subunit [Hadesarchaea archaeon]
MTKLTPPLSEGDIRRLRAGDLVTITGRIVTARDKAHVRITKGRKSPVGLRGGVIYHCGPLAKRTPKGWQILSAGPTTSARMDPMQVEFVKRTGVRALIGKGGVNEEIAGQLAKLGCVYLAFTGGAGVIAARAIEKIEKILWEDLGPAEAIWVLRVRNFGPLVVAVDTRGNNLYLREKR